MFTDDYLYFSKSQAITASAESTYYLDKSHSKDIGPGTPMYVCVCCEESFNTLTSLDIALQSHEDTGFSTGTETLLTKNFLLADLAINASPLGMPSGVSLYKSLVIGSVPWDTDERYLRMYYTVNGSAPSTGKLTSWLCDRPPANAVFCY